MQPFDKVITAALMSLNIWLCSLYVVQSAMLSAEPRLCSRPVERTMTDQFHAWLEPQGV